jgi:hypothetical protein
MSKSKSGLFDWLPAGDEMFNLFTVYRTLWCSGRPGGGKTSLAVYLALRLVQAQRVSGIGTNTRLHMPAGWVESVVDSASALVEETDIALIVDEAWSEVGVGNDKAVKTWLAYPRKKNQYLLFPSVLPISRQVAVYRVERVLNLSGLGIPVWCYRYTLTVGLGESVTGVWYWRNPARVFGVYDHTATIGNDYYVYRYNTESARAEDSTVGG